MSVKLELLVRNLRKLEKAYDKLSSGIPNPRIAEANADKALAAVTSLLSDPELASTLDALIVGARQQFETGAKEFDDPGKKRKEELFAAEAKVLRNSGLGQKELVDLYGTFQEVKAEKGSFVANTEDLRNQLELLHKRHKEEIEDSRDAQTKEATKEKSVAGGCLSNFGDDRDSGGHSLPSTLRFFLWVGRRRAAPGAKRLYRRPR